MIPYASLNVRSLFGIRPATGRPHRARPVVAPNANLGGDIFFASDRPKYRRHLKFALATLKLAGSPIIRTRGVPYSRNSEGPPFGEFHLALKNIRFLRFGRFGELRRYRGRPCVASSEIASRLIDNSSGMGKVHPRKSIFGKVAYGG